MIRHSLRAAAGAVACLALAAPLAASTSTIPSATTDHLSVASKYEVVTLTGLETVTPGLATSVVIPLAEGDLKFDLEPHSIRAVDFTVWVEDGFGLVPHPAPPVRTYRGNVEGFPDSFVWGAIVDGRFDGAYRLTDDSSWVSVSPLNHSIPNADPKAHAVVASADIPDTGHICGADHGAGPVGGAQWDWDNALTKAQARKPAAPAIGFGTARIDSAEIAEANGPEGGVIRVTDIAIDTDVEYVNLNGGNITATINDIENIMAGVTNVYERDVNITYEITGIIVRTGSSPYTTNNAPLLLDQVFSTWNASPLTTVRRDVVHLFTGKNLQGGTIGIARLAAVCQTGIAYGLSQSRFSNVGDLRVSLTAHELGHNWSSQHCSGGNCFIMCPTVNACGGTTGGNLKFGPSASSQIISYRNSVGCLSVQTPIQALPFEDSFDTNQFDENNWPWFIDAAVVDASDLNPPSPPFAAELRSFADFPLRKGDIRTSRIDASEIQPYFVQFHYAFRSTEADDGLEVSALNVQGRWTVLGVLPASVGNQDFTAGVFQLPFNANHEELRIRFRAVTDSFDDRVYVDDVRVGEFVIEPDPCDGDTNGDGEVDFDDLIEALSTFGPCVDCPADFDGNDEVDFNDLITILSAWGTCP